nr:hypothetical protein Iba_chr07eCG4280 [Ipomoea batatas]
MGARRRTGGGDWRVRACGVLGDRNSEAGGRWAIGNGLGSSGGRRSCGLWLSEWIGNGLGFLKGDTYKAKAICSWCSADECILRWILGKKTLDVRNLINYTSYGPFGKSFMEFFSQTTKPVTMQETTIIIHRSVLKVFKKNHAPALLKRATVPTPASV